VKLYGLGFPSQYTYALRLFNDSIFRNILNTFVVRCLSFNVLHISFVAHSVHNNFTRTCTYALWPYLLSSGIPTGLRIFV